MREFQYNELGNMLLPMETVRLLTKINEYKGKQDLYKKQFPQILDTLRNVSIIQSTKASNAIEGIIITDQRLKSIMDRKTEPRDRSEGEIAGYRDVLDTIHASYDAIPITPGVILQLHRDMSAYIPTNGGSWKRVDNAIHEKLPTGEVLVRFLPLPATETPDAMERLCQQYREQVRQQKVEPLLLIAVYLLDFLCVHPFDDGNGRMSRLLALLLLYQSQYEVGRYISLERIIDESKPSYYETLQRSSMAWREHRNDIFPWVNYFLGTIVAAYKELEDRVGVVQTAKGNKEKRIELYITNKIGYFSKEDVRNACPDVSESTINRVLAKLRTDGVVEPMGKGRSAKWRRLQ